MFSKALNGSGEFDGSPGNFDILSALFNYAELGTSTEFVRRVEFIPTELLYSRGPTTTLST